MKKFALALLIIFSVTSVSVCATESSAAISVSIVDSLGQHKRRDSHYHYCVLHDLAIYRPSQSTIS